MLSRVLKIYIICFFVLVFVTNFIPRGEQHFSYIANSFLHGKTYFLEQPGSWADTVFFNNHYYWPEGFFPSIILIPFIALFGFFNQFFAQGYLQFFIVLGVFYLVFKITQKHRYSRSDSLYLAFAFCFSTAFLGVAVLPWSWQFSQVTAVFLEFLIINEYLSNKRYWLLGLLSGFLVLTRITASLAILFIALHILLLVNTSFSNKLKDLLKLSVPYGIFFIILALYNFARFNNFFEQGYSWCLCGDSQAYTRDHYGVFSILHIPGNLYYFLLSGPLPAFWDTISHVLKYPFVKANPWGMSIFVTSPMFFYLFLLSYKDKLSKILIITAIAIVIPIFFYYGIGYRQFGYRYSLDFLPLLFFLLIRNYKHQFRELSSGFKIIILISALTNLYLFTTIYN